MHKIALNKNFCDLFQLRFENCIFFNHDKRIWWLSSDMVKWDEETESEDKIWKKIGLWA
jgi:hypothetical protein